VTRQILLTSLTWIVRLSLAAVFIYAGVIKASDPNAFAAEIEAYRLIAGTPARLAAAYLPSLEIAVGIALLTPWLVRGAAFLMAGLLAIFLVALLSAAWRGLDVSCGCFGAEAVRSEGLAKPIARDFLMLAGAVLVWLRRANEEVWTPGRREHRPR